MGASPESRGFSPPEPTWAESRPAATRAVWRRRSFSAASPPKAPSGDRLEVGAAAQVARERGRGDLRHVQALVVLLDLLADAGRVAVALAQLVAVRGPDEAQVRMLLRLPVLHRGADASAAPRTREGQRGPPCRRPRRLPPRPSRSTCGHAPRSRRSSRVVAPRSGRPRHGPHPPLAPPPPDPRSGPRPPAGALVHRLAG